MNLWAIIKIGPIKSLFLVLVFLKGKKCLIILNRTKLVQEETPFKIFQELILQFLHIATQFHLLRKKEMPPNLVKEMAKLINKKNTKIKKT